MLGGVTRCASLNIFAKIPLSLHHAVAMWKSLCNSTYCLPIPNSYMTFTTSLYLERAGLRDKKCSSKTEQQLLSLVTELGLREATFGGHDSDYFVWIISAGKKCQFSLL